MDIQTRIRADIYKALRIPTVISIVGHRIYWGDVAKKKSEPPMIVYSLLDVSGICYWGELPSVEDFIVQVDILVASGRDGMNTINNLSKAVIEAMSVIGYKTTTKSGVFTHNYNIVSALRFDCADEE